MPKIIGFVYKCVFPFINRQQCRAGVSTNNTIRERKGDRMGKGVPGSVFVLFTLTAC